MNSPPGNFFRLSTDQFAEGDRIEAARELIGRSLMKMEFDLLPDIPFNVDMVFRVLPDFGLASGTCSAMDCLRTAQMIESDDLILTVAMSGGGVLHVRDSEIPIGGGMAALTRTTDVSRCAVHSTSEFVNFRFPFDKIAPMVADLDAAAMRPIPVHTEALRLLVHYASLLKNEDMLATPRVQSLVSSHLQDLAVLAIGATRDAEMIASHCGIPAARLRAIKADISRNFADRHLSIDAVALRNGITPRYVSMLLENDATTFSEFVLAQRLHRAHHMLSDQRWSDRTVSSVAFDAGFGDLSYFNRAFRRRYGAPPSTSAERRWASSNAEAWPRTSDYAGACHRAAPCADPLGSNPPHGLQSYVRSLLCACCRQVCSNWQGSPRACMAAESDRRFRFHLGGVSVPAQSK